MTGTTAHPVTRRRGSVVAWASREVVPPVALWAAAAVALSAFTVRVQDWFVMPNELLYERCAISVVQHLSLLPRLREHLIASYDQLYPLLVAPAFAQGTVASDLAEAHVVNAFVMTSAGVPAYLLARRVTGRRSLALAVAALSVAVPWIVLASFLLTEVAAYPAFLWAMLAVHRATVRPSRANDLLAVGAIALAFFARTQLALLAAVLPLAVVARELGAGGEPGAGRALPALGRAVARHRLLAGIYATAAAALVALAAVGRLPSALGVYGAAIGDAGDEVAAPVGAGALARSFVEHLATFSLALGILPLVAGVAWLAAAVMRRPAREEAHAFACVGLVAVVLVLVQVTIFDVRFGGGFVHDRYLLYLAPLLLLACVAAVAERRPLGGHLALPAGLVALGFAVGTLPRFTWEQFDPINAETPASALYRPLVELAGGLPAARGLLAGLTLLLAAALAALARSSRPRLAAGLAAVTLAAVPGVTGYLFVRLLDTDGWSERPLSGPAEGLYDWVDAMVGADAEVAMAPYPVSSAYFVNQRVWRDYEFWNKSIHHDVQRADESFPYTGKTFTKLVAFFNPVTGIADVSPAPYVLQANEETRFRVSGTVRAQKIGVKLIQARLPWRTDWLTDGLYADGWTRPGTTARIRVYAAPDQARPLVRTLSLAVRTSEDVDRRRVQVESNLETRVVAARSETTRVPVHVCVPAFGFAEVRLAAPGVSRIPGDLRSIELSRVARRGGVKVAEIALADERGPACTATD